MGLVFMKSMKSTECEIINSLVKSIHQLKDRERNQISTNLSVLVFCINTL